MSECFNRFQFIRFSVHTREHFNRLKSIRFCNDEVTSVSILNSAWKHFLDDSERGIRSVRVDIQSNLNDSAVTLLFEWNFTPKRSNKRGNIQRLCGGGWTAMERRRKKPVVWLCIYINVLLSQRTFRRNFEHAFFLFPTS